MRRKILWIPHTAWELCQAQRPRLLIDALRQRYEIHVVTWENQPPGRSKWRFLLNPVNHWRSLTTYSRRERGLFVHHAAVPLPLLQRLARGYPPEWTLALPQRFFQDSLRQLHRHWHFDAAVVSSSHHWTGYPPQLGVPVVFDYLDTSPPEVEAAYLRLASRVVTVSHYLADLVRRRGHNARVIPNGVHCQRLSQAVASRARARWGLEGKTVVSLIGLTCSPRLYFLDALAQLTQEFPDLVFVAAGSGPGAEAIRRRCQALRIPHVLTGWVDPAEVPDLFAASDVGLYPGDDSPYYDGACPLKVLEYTTARVPVVVNRCEELIRLGFSSLIIRPANADAFADGLRSALRARPTVFPDMMDYDWSRLASALGDEIDDMLATAVALPLLRA
jgi:glycosyltransferase involved in cell wall biosynthesis